jgi:predicted MFS family arabinose efflux permease
VALLTGSKNTLKGVGFFLGGALLALLGFRGTIAAMACALLVIWLASLLLLQQNLGKAKNKPKFSDIFSKSAAVNALAAARLFLFAARDVWFVVALPVYLASTFGWDYWRVGGFLALWIIAYGVVQALTPRFTSGPGGRPPDGKSVFHWGVTLAMVPAGIAIALAAGITAQFVLLGGLLLFGALFAVNSSLHSYLIVSYATEDGVSLDVGFYYMANAMGRLLGTVLSGWIFQSWGLTACLWVSTVFLALAAILSLRLPRHSGDASPGTL